MAGAHGIKKKKGDEEIGPPPPDGGWGWMVVFGSFMIHIITDGVTYSFGVFYDEFLDYFKEGKGATSWILSILVGVTLCSGPISSSFVNRWGCRPVTIVGSILASICLVISFWAQSVTVLYLTIGLGTGFGFGLIYLPAIVSVTTYFEKKRSLATGIAVCGSGFGTFIFAPIITALLESYGWRGALLIIAAIVLECIIFGALFRPLEFKKGHIEMELTHGDDCIPLKATDGSLDIHSTPIYNTNHYLTAGNSNIHRPRSMGHVAVFGMNKPERNGNTISYGALEKCDTARFALSQPMLTQSAHHTYDPFKRKNSQKGQIYRPDVFYQGSLMNIPSYKSKTNLGDEDDDLMQRRPSSLCDKHAEKESSICGIVPCSRETKDTLKTMLDFSLFKDIIFILFTLSNFLTSIGFNVPYVYIVSRARELGITTEDASLLLSVIGIANTIGRIVLGYISDKPWVNRLWVYNSCLTICGIATALSAFCLDFYSLAIYATVFGFTIGAYVGLTSVILVDLLGLDKLTNAFGLLLLFQGIASLIGPPIAGGLYDALDSYDPGFYLAGSAIALSGMMLFCIPTVQKWQKKRRSLVNNTDI